MNRRIRILRQIRVFSRGWVGRIGLIVCIRVLVQDTYWELAYKHGPPKFVVESFKSIMVCYI